MWGRFVSSSIPARPRRRSAARRGVRAPYPWSAALSLIGPRGLIGLRCLRRLASIRCPRSAEVLPSAVFAACEGATDAPAPREPKPPRRRAVDRRMHAGISEACVRPSTPSLPVIRRWEHRNRQGSVFGYSTGPEGRLGYISSSSPTLSRNPRGLWHQGSVRHLMAPDLTHDVPSIACYPLHDITPFTGGKR